MDCYLRFFVVDQARRAKIIDLGECKECLDIQTLCVHLPLHGPLPFSYWRLSAPWTVSQYHTFGTKKMKIWLFVIAPPHSGTQCCGSGMYITNIRNRTTAAGVEKNVSSIKLWINNFFWKIYYFSLLKKCGFNYCLLILISFLFVLGEHQNVNIAFPRSIKPATLCVCQTLFIMKF